MHYTCLKFRCPSVRKRQELYILSNHGEFQLPEFSNCWYMAFGHKNWECDWQSSLNLCGRLTTAGPLLVQHSCCQNIAETNYILKGIWTVFQVLELKYCGYIYCTMYLPMDVSIDGWRTLFHFFISETSRDIKKNVLTSFEHHAVCFIQHESWAAESKSRLR